MIVALYLTQYSLVATIYPRYNFALRDRIEEASHAIYRVPDFAALMEERYGDNITFMKKVLSDPELNGSKRGIDLLSKSGVRRAMKANVDLEIQKIPPP